MQIQVYMPGKAAVGYGIVRTLVKDSRDTPVASRAVESQVYLDSDGQINNLKQPPLNLVGPAPRVLTTDSDEPQSLLQTVCQGGRVPHAHKTGQEDRASKASAPLLRHLHKMRNRGEESPGLAVAVLVHEGSFGQCHSMASSGCMQLTHQILETCRALADNQRDEQGLL